jgi:hypothetical protein
LQAAGAKLAAFFLQDTKIKGLNHSGHRGAQRKPHLRESAFSAVEILDEPKRTVSPKRLLPTSGERYICLVHIYRTFMICVSYVH